MSQPRPKIFNTAGVCVPSEHYMLPVLPRIPDIDEMIKGKYYFTIHAPRQSGKTTFLNFLTEKINSDGTYYAFRCSLATLTCFNAEYEAISSIAAIINKAIGQSNVPALRALAYPDDAIPYSDPAVRIKKFLTHLSVNLDKELVVFFDEADCLAGPALITFLAQVRDGYLIRHQSAKTKFPRSMALVGMRDVRDYLAQARPEDQSSGLASPFNVIKKALTLANFTREEIGTLYGQHAEATGQAFSEGAVNQAWSWTGGQPWLVNALAYEVIAGQLKYDYAKTVTGSNIDQAAETLIRRRDTHIDSLLQRLKEPRVVGVMDAVFAGTISTVPITSDDRQYCIDLGLVVKDDGQKLKLSNRIYKDAIDRSITNEIQHVLPDDLELTKWTDGKMLFISNLLKEFQNFSRHCSESFPLRFIDFAAFKYDEATCVFILLAFLQKVINSGGKISKDSAEGRGRVDVEITYQSHRYLIEAQIKGVKPLPVSIEQLSKYLERANEKEGWLVVFDKSTKRTWDEKIYWDTQIYQGKTIHIVGC